MRGLVDHHENAVAQMKSPSERDLDASAVGASRSLRSFTAASSSTVGV
jgi:hypothetical protein